MTWTRKKFWSRLMAEQEKHEAVAAGIERQDLAPRSVYGFLLSLPVGVIAVAILLWGLYHALYACDCTHQPEQIIVMQQTRARGDGVAQHEINIVPQPRVDKNERLE